jgi:hypothetical protein
VPTLQQQFLVRTPSAWNHSLEGCHTDAPWIVSPMLGRLGSVGGTSLASRERMEVGPPLLTWSKSDRAVEIRNAS